MANNIKIDPGTIFISLFLVGIGIFCIVWSQQPAICMQGEETDEKKRKKWMKDCEENKPYKCCPIWLRVLWVISGLCLFLIVLVLLVKTYLDNKKHAEGQREENYTATARQEEEGQTVGAVTKDEAVAEKGSPDTKEAVVQHQE